MTGEARALESQRKLETLVSSLRRSSPIQTSDDVKRLCRQAGIGNEDGAAIETQSPAGLELYRQFLLARVVRALGSAMPLTAALHRERFNVAAKQFAATHQIETSFLRKLTQPFLISVERQWCDDPAVGRGGWELAHYEAARVEVASALPGWPIAQQPSNGPGSFSLCYAARILVNDNPVHRWYETETKIALHNTSRYWLLLYRGDDFAIHCLELSELAFCLVVHLTRVGSSFAQALQVACSQLGILPTEALLDSIAVLVNNLIERRVLVWNDPI